ncbi:hypothetical protein I4U23_018271 [Adineta vaga]|nr:hypothetical protein I4U23_018271 [Adineta vaga]
MAVVELIPINKGNSVILHDTNLITFGRIPTIGCLDNKISRNHAQVWLKSDGTVWIKAVHHNPTFYRTNTNQIVTLTKNKEYQLYHDDQFGLLPDEYFYRVAIKSQDKELENVSTVPKSPVKDNEIQRIKNHDADDDDGRSQAESNSNPTITHTLPDSLDNNSISKSDDKESNEDKITTTARIRPRIHAEEKKIKQIIYDDDTDDEFNPVPSTSTTTINNQATVSASADSTRRDRCPYGESCYRKNLIHRQEVSHPGDPDWEIKDNDEKKTKPDCPYGNECYRQNADHLNEYSHPRKKCIELNTKSRSTKRKKIEDEDDDDDDGLPNEYDYNDSFINDDDFDTDTTNDEKESVESDEDTEWKPEKKYENFDDTDDVSSAESERELTNHEAERFVQNSSSRNHHDSSNKKPRVEKDDD